MDGSFSSFTLRQVAKYRGGEVDDQGASCRLNENGQHGGAHHTAVHRQDALHRVAEEKLHQVEGGHRHVYRQVNGEEGTEHLVAGEEGLKVGQVPPQRLRQQPGGTSMLP
ncbi:hypothetical protein TYRP_011690 [Tyrophagus putrescentiae]|nr:hypothetical protein TYRP_011690 [Tyrophagus putrescentiae]